MALFACLSDPNPMRRVFDLICAAAGLALVSPLFSVLALAIKLEDGGPVIYSPPRMGRDFRVFRLHKFRTMIPNPGRAGVQSLTKATSERH